MKCFAHHDRDAVGICAACMRGLCSECAADLGRGLACKGRCELELRRMHDLRDFSFAQPGIQRVVLERNSQILRSSGVFLFLMGIAIGVGGYFVPRMGQVLYGFGGLLIAWGAFQFVRGRFLPRTDQFRLCPQCGYNLTGNKSGKCPECGSRM